MRWLGLLFLLWATPLHAQRSLKDFPTVRSVSQVTLVGYLLIFDLSPVTPSDDFRLWWDQMEECTGIVSGEYENMKWSQANQIIDPTKIQAYWGVHFSDLLEIVVLRNLSSERLENTVKHEILHHLIKDSEHKEAAFIRCLPLGIEHD